MRTEIAEAEGRFIVVENLRKSNLALEHGASATVQGFSLAPMGQRGHVAVLDVELWQNSPSLRRAEMNGYIRTYRAEEPPEEPYWPSDSDLPTDRNQRMAVINMVTGYENDRVDDLIEMTATREGGGVSDVDGSYMRQKFLPTLRSAEDWLNKLGDKRTKEQNRRLRKIKARIREVERM
jgi:hypothetical protein